MYLLTVHIQSMDLMRIGILAQDVRPALGEQKSKAGILMATPGLSVTLQAGSHAAFQRVRFRV